MNDIQSGLTELLKEKSAQEILATETDGAYFYALSPDRLNALEWLPFRKEESVLQAGAEFGVFCRLAERTASWEIYEDDPAQLDPVRARLAGKAGEQPGKTEKTAGKTAGSIVENGGETAETAESAGENAGKTGEASENTGRISGKEDAPDGAGGAACRFGNITLCTALPEGHRDTVIFCGWPGREKAERILAACTPDRAVVLADNAGALRFLTGAARKENGNYAAAAELETAAAETGFPVIRRYYPLPSAAFARDIRGEACLPGRGDFRGISEDYTEERFILCDEEAIYDSLSEHYPDTMRQYAPSFLFIMEKEAEHLPDYIRYNRTRKPGYCIRTEVYAGEQVVKTALYPEADAHITAFASSAERLKKVLPEGLGLLAPSVFTGASGRTAAAFPFLPGKSLGKRLASEIRSGKAPEEEIRALLPQLLGPAGTPQYNLDILFDNVMESGDRKTLIDYEWVREAPVSRDFVCYRILRYFYEDNHQSLTAYTDMAAFLAVFGISAEKKAEFDRLEDEFQVSVHGEESERPERRFRKTAQTISGLRETERRAVADELDELKTTLRKEREVERLSQQHIRNIENINKARDAEIAAQKAELDYLKRHEGLLSRAKRGVIRKIDAWAPRDSKKRVLLWYIKGTLRHPVTYLKRYLTKEGRNVLQGDFTLRGEFCEAGVLSLPVCEQPVVSIIIPAYNQVQYTYACIRSVLEHTDPAEIPYEVILADDASSDATVRITDWIRNLKIARTGGNLGFLRNCNNAAAGARGEFLFFLNNDTRVTEGWLSSLLRLIRSDERIGMAGSKLVYPDGRLQEAGGIIWSDASGWNYGRMDDPGKFQYNYVRETDYISGAAILIRHDLWKEIGGFDERYAPAYCEDSDLAFEVRRHGKKVVYQPDSVVIHYEGVSNGTDVNGTGLKRYQIQNQEKFREKWRKELAGQSENTGNPNPFAARDRSQHRKTILVIDHYVPQRDRDAGSRTTFQYLGMFIRQGFNVKFLGDNFLHEEPYSHELQQMGVEILYGDEIRETVFDWIEKNRDFIDIAYLNRPHIAAKYIDFLKEQSKIRCIYYGHDLHYLRIRREYELSGEIRKRRESEYWRGMEYQVMEQADMVYYPSQDEIDEIHARRPEIPAKAITAYIYDHEELPEGAAAGKQNPGRNGFSTEREGLLFVGGFKHPPNADGVLWFIREIWPLIRRELPELEFYIAGSHPTEEITALSGKDGVKVLGFVTEERLEELYRNTRITVVPLRYGAGVKGKVVEALDRGAAIVTTPVGAEGIPEAETVMKICRRPAEFAQAVLRLYGNTEELERMARADAPFIRKHYSTEAVWNGIREDFGSPER